MKKTKAPFILFGFLGILVSCIVISIVIALKNPIMEDRTYFTSKKELDSQVNDLLKEQKWFLQHHKVFLKLNQKTIELIPPYLKKPNDQSLGLKASQTHAFTFLLQGHPLQELKTHFYLEKINSTEDRLDLGDLSVFEVLIPQKGRYKIIAVIEYERNNEQKRLFFEKEIFVF